MPDTNAIAHVVDWTQYPLIAILLGVIFFAQKFYRDDRAKQDERLDKLLDGYQKTIENNTLALRDLEMALNVDRIRTGANNNGPTTNRNVG